MKKLNIHQRGAVLFLLILALGFVTSPVQASTSMQFASGSSEEQIIQETATDFAKPESDAILVSVQLDRDCYWKKELWNVRWISPEHKIIEVGLDAATHEIVFYLDTSRLHNKNIESSPISDEDAFRIALTFLEQLEEYGIMSIPEDAVFEEMERDNDGWQLSWTHIVQGYSVLEDFIRIRISQESGLVYSYSKCWHAIEIVPEVVLSRSEAIEIARGFRPLSTDKKTACNLYIVGEATVDKVDYSPHIAWVIEEMFRDGSRVIYHIDAKTEELLFADATLDINMDVFAWDPGYNPTYECALDIYNRFDTATEWYARYFEDPTYYQEVSQLQYERVLYHIGHGGYGTYESEMQTYLYTESDNIWAGDVDSIDLSDMKLAFLCGCWTAANNVPIWWWWVDVDLSLAEGFLAGDAQCVFGWDEAVLKTEAMKFSRYFFDYAVNSYDFESCYDYAYSKVQSGTQDIARIYGDDSLYLDEYDYGADSWPGTNLGSGYDKYFHVYDEGLWDPDVDWYRFTVSGDRQINIWAIPQNDDLDIAFYVYDEYMYTVLFRDSYGPGDQEHGNFGGGGQTYFLYVYKTDTHGGYYDLTVHISS